VHEQAQSCNLILGFCRLHWECNAGAKGLIAV
jgi:hypothetical protein